jgi:hypothetical protein
MDIHVDGANLFKEVTTDLDTEWDVVRWASCCGRTLNPPSLQVNVIGQ